MSEEKQETNCICQNKTFRKFLVIALGTFTGVYAALTLFAATHRPPMMPCPMRFGAPAPVVAPCPFHKHHHFDKHLKGDKEDFQKTFNGHQGPSPFETNKKHDKD